MIQLDMFGKHFYNTPNYFLEFLTFLSFFDHFNGFNIELTLYNGG